VSSSGRIRVWDAPTRLFHWTLAVLVVFSFTTGKVGGAWMEWHMRSGYAILALVLFRLAWGVVGSDTARFSRFVRGPRVALAYARETISSRHPVVLGHNPLGGWMVLLMLGVLAAQAASGLFTDDDSATQGPLAAKASGAWIAKMSAFHSYNGWTIAIVVGVHVIAIAAYRWGLRVDLVAPMVHGWKTVPGDLRTPEPGRAPAILAAILAALCAGFVYWLVVVYPKG
jgi:cytochrome b